MHKLVLLSTLYFFTISGFSQCDIDFDSADPTCFGACNGQIVANATGTAPIDFNWSTGSTNFYIDELCAGTYTLTITDDLGCVHTDSLIVSESEDTFTVDAYYISGTSDSGWCDGEIGWETAGGAPDYSLNWFDCETGVIYDDLPGFCAGDYYVIIQDSNGCIDSSNCVTVSDPVAHINEMDKFVNFEIFPNPSQDEQVLLLHLNKSAYVLIQIVSIDGKIIQTIHDDFLDSGENSFTISLGSIASGFYSYSIILDDENPRYLRGIKE